MIMKRINFSLFGCDFGTIIRDCKDCPEDEPNRIIHAAFYLKGATINKTASGLVDSLLLLERSCDAFIVRNTNGTMAESTYQTGKGAGKQVSRVLSGTHSVTLTDFDMIDNIENFWNKVILGAQNFYMVFFTSSTAWIVEKPLSITPSSPITDDINTFIEGTAKVDWSAKGLPTTLRLGADEVDRLEPCAILFESEDGFNNESGSNASISADGYTISADSNDAINVRLTSPVAIDTVEAVTGTVPTGLDLYVTSDGLGVKLVGIVVATGTYQFTIKAANTCGVGAEFDIKVVIS